MESNLICRCYKVSEQDLIDAVNNGAKSFEEVQEATNVSTGCGGCEDTARDIVENLLKK